MILLGFMLIVLIDGIIFQQSLEHFHDEECKETIMSQETQDDVRLVEVLGLSDEY